MQAATRGDGEVGEDALNAALHSAGIPQVVPAAAGDFTVRGELHITRDDFALVNQERVKAGEAPFATARNAAAGAARLLEGWERRRLRFAAFELIPLSAPAAGAPRGGKRRGRMSALETQWEGLRKLEELGFGAVTGVSTLAPGLDDAVKAGKIMLQGRDELPYESDGCVIKVNSIEVRGLYQLGPCLLNSSPAHNCSQISAVFFRVASTRFRFVDAEHITRIAPCLQDEKSLGSVGSDPKFAVAWKPPAQMAVTLLHDIELELGRTGAHCNWCCHDSAVRHDAICISKGCSCCRA
jgi:NAD-dependent DNA ligase